MYVAPVKNAMSPLTSSVTDMTEWPLCEALNELRKRGIHGRENNIPKRTIRPGMACAAGVRSALLATTVAWIFSPWIESHCAVFSTKCTVECFSSTLE